MARMELLRNVRLAPLHNSPLQQQNLPFTPAIVSSLHLFSEHLMV